MSDTAVAEVPAETLLTDAPTTPEGTTSPTPDAPAAESAATPEAPVAPVYEFVAPEGVTLDAGLIAQVTPLFAAANLAPETAQQLVDVYAAHQSAMHVAQVAAWTDAVKADPEIGGAKLEATLASAKRVLHAHASPEFMTYLETTGLGSHPEAVRMFAKLGELTREDTTIRAASGGLPEKSAASLLYPSMSKE